MTELLSCENPNYLHMVYTIPRPRTGGLRILKAKVTWGKTFSKKHNVKFERDGFVFYLDKAHQLLLRIPTQKDPRKPLSSRMKNKLRRFVRDFIKSKGGNPQHSHFWLDEY